jgi:hypothetical protein
MAHVPIKMRGRSRKASANGTWQGSQTRKVCDDFTYCGAPMASLNLEPMIPMRDGID